MSTEQLDDQVDQVDPTGGALDEIGNEAAFLEGQQQQQQQQQQAPEPGPHEAMAWAQIPAMLGGILAMALPEVAPAYNEQACMRWGEGMAAVANKYGWQAGETMARWAPEIALTMATVPLVLPVVAAVKARKEAAAASKAKPIDQAEDEPMLHGAPVTEAPTVEPVK